MNRHRMFNIFTVVLVLCCIVIGVEAFRTMNTLLSFLSLVCGLGALVSRIMRENYNGTFL